MSKLNRFTVFEHQSLWRFKGEQKLSDQQLKSLQKFHSDNGNEYYTLVHQGIKFNSFVGVIQVGQFAIEVLPKADKKDSDENEGSKDEWRERLIGMLRAVNAFDIHAPSFSALTVKQNFILDLYFEIFIKEIEYLFHKGLIKKYRKQEGNTLALKGNLLFSRHLRDNLIHKERFYVRYTTYDRLHHLHQIIYKTLLLLKRINTNRFLNSRIGNLLLNFPEMKDIKVTAAVFKKIKINRKSEDYKNAIEIAKLLLLNYHPDLSSGRDNVLAIMFDMNKLWEEFVYKSLRKNLSHKIGKEITVSKKTSKSFWKPNNGRDSKIIPDIVINEGKDDAIVLDTKWKTLGGKNPSIGDLRQLFVYHLYFKANKVALVYPGVESIKGGEYYSFPERKELEDCKSDEKSLPKMECGVITIPAGNDIFTGKDVSFGKFISTWQNSIAEKIAEFMT